MREIKFRIWDEENRKMCKAVPIKTYMEAAAVTIPEGEERFIMQFTGLKDKNGKEIYEGDIVNLIWTTADLKDKKYGQVYATGEVKFAHGSFYLDRASEDNLRFATPPYPETMEVIGNIYENAELLK